MPCYTCVVCGSNPTQDPYASFHRLPSDPARRTSRLDAFGLEESGQLKVQSRVCCCFLQLVGTFRPLQSNLHFNAGTAWESNCSLRVAPGISAAVMVTETGSNGHRSRPQFSVILRRILTPRTPFSRTKTAAFGSVLLNRVYGTDRTPGALKVGAQRFLRSLLQYIL